MQSLMAAGSEFGQRMLGMITRTPRLLLPPSSPSSSPSTASHQHAAHGDNNFPDFQNCDCHFGKDTRHHMTIANRISNVTFNIAQDLTLWCQPSSSHTMMSSRWLQSPMILRATVLQLLQSWSPMAVPRPQLLHSIKLHPFLTMRPQLQHQPTLHPSHPQLPLHHMCMLWPVRVNTKCNVVYVSVIQSLCLVL